MRKIILSVMMIMMLCVSAWADVVYTTDAGNIGLIKVRGADSVDLRGTQYSGAAGDSFLSSYWDGSNTRVILVDRTTDTTTSGDTVSIFNPSDLTKPADTTQRVLEGVYSTRAMIGSSNGRGLFFTSGSSIHEFSTEDFSPTRSYTYKPKTSDDIMPQMTAMLLGSYTVYVLAEQEESNDVLFVFDGQLREDIEDFTRIALPYGTHDLAWLSDSRFVLAHDYGLDIMRGGRFTGLLSADNPVKSVCQDAGGGCYFVEQAQDGETYTTTLKHYTANGVTTLYTDTAGSACSVLRDGDNGILAALVGSKILVYKMKDDALALECDSTSIGGLPTNIAMSYVSGDDSSSSGCSVSSAGVLLLLSLILMKRR